MDAPDVVELLAQIGLRNARELKLLIHDVDNVPAVAAKFETFYRDNPQAKRILSLLFDNYPFVPENTQDLIAILKKTRHIFDFFNEQEKDLQETEFEDGIRYAYKLVYKILYNPPEEVFKNQFIGNLQKDTRNKTLQKNRYQFIYMLRVIIDQGHMIWDENIAYFEPMFRDKLEAYQLKEEILEELLFITRDSNISFFLGAYLYLFFVIPRTAK